MNKKLVGFILSLVALAAIGYSYKSANDSKQGVYTLGAIEGREEFYESTYASYLSSNGYQGSMSNGEVVVDINDFKTTDGAQVTTDGDGVITPDQGMVTWEFDVETPGFYNLEVGYIPVEGKKSTIERKMYIDDQIHFKGMNQVSFQRQWVNDGDIEVRDDNEMKPDTVEISNESSVFVQDSQRRGTEAYKFYLDEGTHTISFEAIKEPLKITSLTFKAEEELLSYEDSINQLQAEYPLYEGELLVGQAERNEGITTEVMRTSRAIGLNSNYGSPKLEPIHASNVIFNTIGGSGWKTAGEAVTWEVEVPETGLYQLSFNGRQTANRGTVSYRKLTVNGEVPFKEAETIGFTYSPEFENYIIGGENGAYLIPLEAGTNTISLEVVLGDLDRSVTEVEESLFVLNDAYRRIIQLIGTTPQSYIDYEVGKKLPEIPYIFEQESIRLRSVLDEFLAITGEKGDLYGTIEKIVLQLERLAEDPEEIVVEHSELKNNLSTLGNWTMEVASMPLEIDSLTLSAADGELRQTKPGFIEGAIFEVQRFFATFLPDTSTSITGNDKEGQSVRVWIDAGKDQAQIAKNLILEEFTPQTGINVTFELIPQGVIIPATLAGEGPDVVIGMAEAQAMNFAARNSLVDISQFPDFDEHYDQYAPSAFEGVTFLDGIYGMPETQTFNMLFYRQDILDELGLEVPQTWEDVKAIIPVLQMNNYDFFLPRELGTYASMVFQQGGDIYLGEGSDYGIQTAFYEDLNMDIFEDFADLYTSYQLPEVADFTNRFRTGEMPVGIAPYTLYSTLQLSAPEIRGLWGFTPMPGTEQADGEIDNTYIAATTQCIMLEVTEDKDSAWEFMKWWTSADTQYKYATTLESLLGPAARYASAKVEVMEQLPWTTAELESLTQQIEYTKGVPEIPGGYMTTRMFTNAINGVVTDGENPREALYTRSKSIDDELTKKREEFNLSTVEDEK